ncbi:nucleotide exchange factor GrpE [[Leptolyngbya] sp. PCC 7376]|uniref:nucleotide exchange factor GrpE n=1 Tax=[Leptolyngbya] sp. PCC 7376 TaxID=111781 RepID=UPI0002D9B6DF|nr:nucleotide exchange factor GrpE [[Leptolyngbya] sp. PCC 7376]
MDKRNVSTELELSRAANVAERQIYRLGQGLIHTFPITDVVKLAQYFEQSVDEFLATFLPNALQPIEFEQSVDQSAEIAALKAECERLEKTLEQQTTDESEEVAALKAEYERLEKTLEQQGITLQQQWQQEALDQLEPWLLQWSAAANAAIERPNFPAKALVSLAKPFEQLLENWDVQPIGVVGDTVEYDPTTHQLVKDGFDVEPGDTVTVQNIGYTQGDRLLHRAKVVG